MASSDNPPRPRLPNAFIGGAQKSGTTSLHRGLDAHPEIFFPERPQEIHFFDVDQNYRRGLDHYASLFAGHGDQPVIAQTSPLYLYEPAVAERIAQAIPDAKLIFILRNAVDRAYSHYWHEVRYGWERLSFEEALAAEAGRLAGGFDARRHYSYLDRGRYARQLRRFYDHFPSEQILVTLYDQLSGASGDLLRACAAFLGAGDGGEGWPASRESGGQRRHNRARIPRVKAVQRLTRPLRHRLAGAAWLVDLVNLRPVAYPAMDADLRRRLEAEMAGEVDELAALTGLAVAERWLPASHPVEGVG